ncbi:MAG: phosphopentomutase [Gammaproteobacteria bacterium]|nr:phosphopentomutase [Gammaproteobacteria bacterium]
MGKAILIILDGLGVGDAPDADAYGDLGSNTLGNMSKKVGGIHVPTLASLGLGNIAQIENVPPSKNPKALFGRLEEISEGKDSTTGHWELMGVVTQKAFPTYPDGFPEELIEEFTAKTGYGVLGNKAASGTDIINELGDEHLATGKLIVYTSADSVFQIAAHEDVIDHHELYRVCEITREFLKPPHHISRVIARPFKGNSNAYERTPYRHDYSIDPPGELILSNLQKHGVKVSSIGKIYDLYNGQGIDETHTSHNNAEGMAQLEKLYSQPAENDELILLNLVDFDMLWGHRNDPVGMKNGLEEFDRWLGKFLPQMQAGDLLMMTADHGNDPTMPGSDHSREHVPIIAYQAGVTDKDDSDPGHSNLGIRKGFMDVGASFMDYFNCNTHTKGVSFLLKT